MKRFSLGLAGRLTLLTVVLLLAGQLINTFLLTTAERRLERERQEEVLIERAVQASRLLEVTGARGRRLPRRRGFRITSGQPMGETLPRAELQLGEALASYDLLPRGYTMRLEREGPNHSLIAAVEIGPDRWLHVAAPLTSGRAIGTPGILLQAGIVSLLLIAPAVWFGRRIARPLGVLTEAADGFLTGKPSPPLPSEAGPPDLAALARAFRALQDRVLGVLSEQAVTIGALGHDLRTPLASLRIRVESVDDDELRDAMIASIDSLAETLDDILALSRASAVAPRNRVEASGIVRAALSHYPAEEVGLNGLEDAPILAAPTSVERALRNLIDNALRYGRSPEISGRRVDAHYVYQISDRGPGLSPEERDRLVAPFERRDSSRNRETGGAGLGLSITKAIAAAHFGQLQLRERDGGGLVAELVLPIASDASQEALPNPVK